MKIAGGASILIVEDEEIVRESLIGFLEREGHWVSAVESGQEAVELLQRKRFDLALVDLKLGDVDGLMVLKEANRWAPDMISIMITGYASIDSAITALRLGAYDYLTKPCRLEELNSTVRRALEQRYLQQQIRETRDYLENVMESIPLGLLTFDQNLHLVRTNREARAIFALGQGWVGRTAEQLLHYPGEQKEWVLRSLREVLTRGEELRLEYLQTERPIPGRLHHLKIVPLKPEGVLLLVEDITEKALLEQRLIQADKMAAKGEMAAQIAHELGNYLCIVCGSAELLEHQLGVGNLEGANQRIKILLDNVLKMEPFIRGLVDFSSLEACKREIDLNWVVQETIELIDRQNRYDNVEFITKLDPTLPKIQADPDQIHQVLLNLFSNAADAMDRGTITVATWKVGKESVVLEVSDTGPGIPPQVLEHIFDPHFSTKAEGHGFGLAICDRILKGHYGIIEVQNQPREGAIFRIRLPIVQPESLEYKPLYSTIPRSPVDRIPGYKREDPNGSSK